MSRETSTRLVDGGGEEVGEIEGAREGEEAQEEDAILRLCNMSSSTSVEVVVVHEGVTRGLESIFPGVSKGGIRSVIPLTIIKASASQNICVCLVLRHRNDPLAVLALSLDKCQYVQIKFQEIAYVCCVVNSGGCTNGNSVKTSLIIEQSAYIGIVQSDEELLMVRFGQQHSDNALNHFRDKSSLV